MRIIALYNIILLFISNNLIAQQNSKTNLVFVDRQGVLRWTKNNAEASFFGVNYTAPFAYSYRAHKALNIDLEKAIRQDVYHMARLGLDAFRVHVWDTEISDSLGNLLVNEHLRLFDFLLAELKKRNIKTIITPIAFWGNGYPEKDEITPGFSRVFGKGGATSNDTAIRAQENYLQQFFKHVNPYTKFTYGNDPDVIAVELNNEPSHSGPKNGVTNYINRLAAAVRSAGWSKPLYYNISQSPYYADAVAKAAIDGVSFQWYPTGLVANQEEQGNFLPNVDRYTIPYDTIPEYRNKSRMVYEFDAADVLQSCMYPAIARSFRQAGFQWATQFAYDPLALAYANTEYQTHYLNLAYTPSKAISLLIASKVFHKVPRLKNYGSYPADSSFDVFRVSYREGLSEMNAEQEFYYSNSTTSKPVKIKNLEHLAGVGTSTVVRYDGLGAYFLDRIAEGLWRLEIMPDAIQIRDPFSKASPGKEVTRIEWQKHPMSIFLPGLGEDVTIKGLNEGNQYNTTASGNNFLIEPGTYLITGATTNGKTVSGIKTGEIGMNEFVAPQPYSKEPFVGHIPDTEVSAGSPFEIRAVIAGIDNADKVTVQLNRLGGGFGQTRMISMIRKAPYCYVAEVPAPLVTPGVLNYRIIIQKANDMSLVFPGNYKGNPFAWDYYNNDTWQTFVAAENGPLEIYSATNDRNVLIYPSFRNGFQVGYITGTTPRRLILKLAADELQGDPIIGFQYSFRNKLKGRESETFDKIVIRARTGAGPVKAKITLTDANASSLSSYISLTNTFRDVEVALNDLKPDSLLLLPRPYPGFQPLWFKGAATPGVFKLSASEKIQVTLGTDAFADAFNKPYSLEVESIWFQKTEAKE